MSEATAVDRLFEESSAVLTALESIPELSLRISAGDNFRKALLLAAASYFEHRLCAAVIEFARERSSGSMLIENFIRNKAISRQYHTWFKWDDGNANHFYALFGPEFRAVMVDKVKTSDELRASVKAFLEIGNERNRLVHQDYATFPLEKTLDEIYNLYRNAKKFIDEFPASLRACDAPLAMGVS